MKSTLIRQLMLAISLGAAVCTFAAEESAPVETKATASAKRVDESKLSPASLKVAKLLQAGMDEKVIVAYVKNNPGPKAPTAEELIYLNELGVTAPVLTALLTETKKATVSAPEVAAAVPAPAPTEKVEVSSNYTPIPGAPPRQVDGSTVVSNPVLAPAPVVVQQPAPPTVVYTQPAPVIVHAPPPVYYDPAPRITFGFGFGHFGHFGHHHSIFRHHHGHFGHHGGHRGRHH